MLSRLSNRYRSEGAGAKTLAPFFKRGFVACLLPRRWKQFSTVLESCLHDPVQLVHIRLTFRRREQRLALRLLDPFYLVCLGALCGATNWLLCTVFTASCRPIREIPADKAIWSRRTDRTYRLILLFTAPVAATPGNSIPDLEVVLRMNDCLLGFVKVAFEVRFVLVWPVRILLVPSIKHCLPGRFYQLRFPA